MNMSPENKAHFEAKKEAIHLILNGIGDEIYSTVDACQTAQEMVEAIERLQQEWSRFVMIFKQQHKLDEVSYHKLFDILKQYQTEVNELRAERLARNANPLALVATAQADQDPYYQTSRSHKSYAPSSKPSILTRSHTTTRHKRKEIAKPITPPSETTFEEDNELEQAQRDKDMQKNLALIAKYFKKIYKPVRNKKITTYKLLDKVEGLVLLIYNSLEFLGVETMVNIFQNILELVVNTAYVFYWIRRITLQILVVSCEVQAYIRRILMDTTYGLSEQQILDFFV
nr:hypothetical protein [Tanacetum cinerariifolium]